ncbi:MAG: VPLPA-CTERM sorting domain-containing protein, partial [Pseudomonadota bacterium]
PGIDLGITFSDNALAIVDADAAGLPSSQGNFGGEPTPDTVLFFLTGSAATLNFADGFTDGFSFFYSSINFTGNIDVYSGLNATGDVLASLTLPSTPFNGEPDPTGNFSPFVPLGVSFDGIAQSVDFGGTINQIGFDNITFGAADPLEGNTGGTVTPPPPAVVPVPASLPLLLGGLGGLALLRRRTQRLA